MFGFGTGDRVKLKDGREGTIERNFIGTLWFQVRLDYGEYEVVHRDEMKKIK